MLELSHDVVHEEDSGLGGEHASRNVVEGECSSAILSNLDVLGLSEYGLHLLFF